MMTNPEKKRILIVDDDIISRLVLKAILERSGYKVEEASNGQLAIDLFVQKPEYYDVVLMDFNMPDMNGAAVTREFRQIEMNNNSATIIGITAHLDPDIKELCIKSGMNAVINKPLDAEKLKDLLQFFSLH